MTDQSELVTRTRQLHARFNAVAEGIEPQALEGEPVCGVWSLRDVAGHLDDWAIAIVEAANEALGRPFTPDPLLDDLEAFNLRHAEGHASEPWATTKANLDATIERSIALLESITAEQGAISVALPWGGSGSLGRLLGGVAGHYEEHIEELEAWRAASG